MIDGEDLEKLEAAMAHLDAARQYVAADRLLVDCIINVRRLVAGRIDAATWNAYAARLVAEGRAEYPAAS